MTVASLTSRIEYTTTSGLLTYAYPFRIFADSDLRVYLDTTLLTLTSQYTVTGAGDSAGGNVVLATNPGNSHLLTIERILPITQGHDYVENDRFPAESHENALDYRTMVEQMLYERDRKRPAFLTGSATKDWTFPDPVSYAANGLPLFVRLNAAHSALEAVPQASDIVGVLDDTVASTTLGGLPSPATPGRLRRVSDDIGGLWLDNGTRWLQVGGQVLNAAESMIGDDSTDNRAALIALIARLPAGGILHIPAGTYRISDTMTDALKSQITIRGAGPGRTILKFTKTLADAAPDLGEGGYAMFKQTTAVTGLLLEGLTLTSTITEAKAEAQSNGTVRGHSVLYLAEGHDITVYRCEITNWGGRTFWIGNSSTASSRVRFESCYAHDTWSDAFVVQNADDVWFVDNLGRNIHPADSDSDGVFNSQFADFCHSTSCRTVHFLGNSAYDVCRVAYLSEGSLAIPGRDITMADNFAKGVGFGCPSGSGAAVWLENTTGLFSCTGFVFDQCELGFALQRENSHIITSAAISNGLIRLQEVAKTAGKADELYGGLRSRCDSLTVTNVTFEQGGPSTSPDNGFYSLLALSEQTILINNCLFDGAPSRSHILLNLDAPINFSLSIIGCTFKNSDCRLISHTGTGAANEVQRLVFSQNLVNNSLDTDTLPLISFTAVNDVTKYVEFNDNIVTVSGGSLSVADFHGKHISVRGNTIVSTDAAQVRLLALNRFEYVNVSDNSFDALSTGEKIVINGGGTPPYTTRYAAIARNVFLGASPDHVDLANLTAGLIHGNVSDDATTRAYTIQSTAADVLVQANHCDDVALTTPASDTIVGRNWVGGAPVPALPQTATIPNGSTSVTVSHGLSYTPLAGDIHVVATNSPPNALTTGIYINTITSTQFNINRNDPGGDATFSWQVVR